jgi:hypothetical protein
MVASSFRSSIPQAYQIGPSPASVRRVLKRIACRCHPRGKRGAQRCLRERGYDVIGWK